MNDSHENTALSFERMISLSFEAAYCRAQVTVASLSAHDPEVVV